MPRLRASKSAQKNGYHARILVYFIQSMLEIDSGIKF